MKKYFDILRSCPIFDGVNDENLTPLLGCLGAKFETYKKGDVIIAEGTSAKYIGVVMGGSAQLERVDFEGNRSIVTNIEPSELFGEAFACTDAAIPFDVIAKEPTEIMFIDCKKIIYTCSKSCEFHSQLTFNLLKIVAGKNIILNQKAEIISKRSTRKKLMTYLLLQAKKCGSRSFAIPYDRQGLADFLQVDRSGLSAEIGKLRDEGILESNRSHFKLL